MLTALFDLNFKEKIETIFGVQESSVNKIIHTVTFFSNTIPFVAMWDNEAGQ